MPNANTTVAALALALGAIPASTALAGGGHHHGGGNHGPVATVEGAGQRLHFTFGGKIRLQGGKAKGDFVLNAHPSAPQGTTLSVACRYRKFAEVTIAGNTATFRAMGKCVRLFVDGKTESFSTTNVFQIVDDPGGDQIDVNFTGESGIAVPAGPVTFGDFTVTPAP